MCRVLAVRHTVVNILVNGLDATNWLERQRIEDFPNSVTHRRWGRKSLARSGCFEHAYCDVVVDNGSLSEKQQMGMI